MNRQRELTLLLSVLVVGFESNFRDLVKVLTDLDSGHILWNCSMVRTGNWAGGGGCGGWWELGLEVPGGVGGRRNQGRPRASGVGGDALTTDGDGGPLAGGKGGGGW